MTPTQSFNKLKIRIIHCQNNFLKRSCDEALPIGQLVYYYQCENVTDHAAPLKDSYHGYSYHDHYIFEVACPKECQAQEIIAWLQDFAEKHRQSYLFCADFVHQTNIAIRKAKTAQEVFPFWSKNDASQQQEDGKKTVLVVPAIKKC